MNKLTLETLERWLWDSTDLMREFADEKIEILTKSLFQKLLSQEARV